jgi:glycosyltransferase involved in cell wall biosynthesis
VKIAHVTDFYLPRLGGIEVHVHDLAQRQRAAGHAVDIITSSPAAKGEADEPGVIRIGTGLGWKHPLNPRAALVVHDVLRDSDYDVVHAHGAIWSSTAFAGALSAVESGIPVVLTWHSLLGWVAPLYRGMDACIHFTPRGIHWTAVSESAAKPLNSMLPSGTKVGILANAVDVEDWCVTPVEGNPNEMHVVAVMRLAPRKRPIHLLKTLRAVQGALPEGVRMRATVIGEGPERGAMEKFLHRHGMQAQVTLPGRLTRAEIREIYRRADVFVAPAKLESFGIAALEARCAGIPVVAMRASGIADFVEDGVDGLLVESDAAMATALVRLATDPGLRTAIAAHNRAVAPPFGWADALATTEKAYTRAAELAGRRRSDVPFWRVLRTA